MSHYPDNGFGGRTEKQVRDSYIGAFFSLLFLALYIIGLMVYSALKGT